MPGSRKVAIFATNTKDHNRIGMSPSKTFARGFVFEDDLKTGRYQVGRRGVAGVAVSNGREVVHTDATGYYALPIDGPCCIFISKPAGYDLPLDENGQPCYFYRYYPEGTPAGVNMHYERLEPTGPLPGLINFPLYRRKKKGDGFQALVFGDIQPERREEIGFFREMIGAELARREADFMIPLGDLTWDRLDFFPDVKEALGAVGHPFFPVAGNHDINFRPADARYTRDTFVRYFGPGYYSFNYGKVHFVVLDDIGYSGWEVAQDVKGETVGYLDERQLEWLANDLRGVPDDRLIFLCSHIPLYTNIAPEVDYRNVRNRAALFEVLRDRRHLFHVAAHTHWVEQVDLRDGGWTGDAPFHSLIAGAACGAWWKGPKDERGHPVRLGMDGVPNGFFRFQFEGNRFRMEYCPTGHRECVQMSIRLAGDGLVTHELLANIYRASPRAAVRCRINGSAPLPMGRTVKEDPYVEQYLDEHRDDYPDWVRARPVAHLWRAVLPAPLPPGEHLIEIAAREPGGDLIRESRRFHIEAPREPRATRGVEMGG